MATLLAALAVASACATTHAARRPPTLVEDLSAQEQGAGGDRLTPDEHARLEKILWKVAGGAPPGGRIVLSVVQPASEPREISGSGRHIVMSEALAGWGLRELGTIGDEYLSFVLAHEIGHLSVSECGNGACGHTLECEQKADRESRDVIARAGIFFTPGALFRASRAWLAFVSRTLDDVGRCGDDGACVVRHRMAAAGECLSSGEVELRYAVLLREEAKLRRGDSWEERGRARDARSEYEKLRTGTLPEYARLCAEIAGARSGAPGGERACLDARQAAFVEAVAKQAPIDVPAQESPELWSEKIRWQRDADWLLAASTGPAWHDFRHPGRGTGWGWIASGTALWQGGDANGPGLRATYGRFAPPPASGAIAAPDAEVSYLGVELVARKVKTLGPHSALVSDIGVGGARIADPSGTRSSVLATLSGVFAVTPVPRVVLGLGGGWSFSGSLTNQLTSQILALQVTLDVYLGNYTTRHMAADRLGEQPRK